MRVIVHVALDFDEATITKEEARRRVETYIDQMFDNDSGILTADGAVLNGVEFDVELE